QLPAVMSARAKAAPAVSTVVGDQKSPTEDAGTNKFLVGPRVLWDRPVSEETFARFHDWAEKFLAAGPENKAALEREGGELAKERRRELAALIKSDPQRALELA